MSASAIRDPSIEPTERVLLITQMFDAPRDIVFRAWTEPGRLEKWLGPRGFTAGSVQQDLRPGGAWCARLTEDGTGREQWMRGVYREIEEPERLVFTFAWDQDDGSRGHETLVTITFGERGGKTVMTFHQAAFESVERRDGHQGGWTSSFDRLGEFLARR
jgi:uncharacterized protein YndB with AHSA1/START domain